MSRRALKYEAAADFRAVFNDSHWKGPKSLCSVPQYRFLLAFGNSHKKTFNRLAEIAEELQPTLVYQPHKVE